MTIVDIHTLRNNLQDYIESVIKYNEIITVTTDEGNTVIISEEKYNSMVETVYLFSRKGLFERIKDGETEDKALMPKYDSNVEW